VIEMRLHAILGKSRLHLASAILSLEECERVFLYGGDEDQFNGFKNALISLIKSRINLAEPDLQKLHRLRLSFLQKIIEFVPIPPLDRRENDMISMIGKLRSRLREMEEPIDGRDVLFYSGTKPHLSLFVSERRFQRILSHKGESLEIHSIGDGSQMKEPEQVKIPKWDVESVLCIHGLTESNGWLVDSDDGGVIGGGDIEVEAQYSLLLDERSKSKVRVVWNVVPTTSTKRKRFCRQVIEINQSMAGSVIHEVADEHLSNWCRNTSFPLPNLEETDTDYLSEEE